MPSKRRRHRESKANARLIRDLTARTVKAERLALACQQSAADQHAYAQWAYKAMLHAHAERLCAVAMRTAGVA